MEETRLSGMKIGREGMENKLNKGGFIKCHDAEEAADVADALQMEGYDWDFVYQKDGQKGIWIEILGVIE